MGVRVGVRVCGWVGGWVEEWVCGRVGGRAGGCVVWGGGQAFSTASIAQLKNTEHTLSVGFGHGWAHAHGPFERVVKLAMYMYICFSSFCFRFVYNPSHIMQGPV